MNRNNLTKRGLGLDMAPSTVSHKSTILQIFLETTQNSLNIIVFTVDFMFFHVLFHYQ